MHHYPVLLAVSLHDYFSNFVNVPDGLLFLDGSFSTFARVSCVCFLIRGPLDYSAGAFLSDEGGGRFNLLTLLRLKFTLIILSLKHLLNFQECFIRNFNLYSNLFHRFYYKVII